MPLFDYRCIFCGLVIESLHSVQHCPDCGTQMSKLPSAPAFKVEGYNTKNGYSKESK